MPIYTKSEFKNECGLNSLSHLSMCISRGKVIVNDDGKIDSSISQNSEFLKVQKSKKKDKKPYNQLTIEDNRLTEKEIEVKQKTLYELEKRKKELEIEGKEKLNRLNELKIYEKEGKLIPVDLVKTLFSIHFKSVVKEFHAGAKNISVEMVKILGGIRKDESKIRDRIIDLINEAVLKSHENTEVEISNIVGEYSSKRSRGESIG